MCFSEPASFGLATTLVPAGIYSLRQVFAAWPRYIPLACIPLGFACQQACEGLVWHGLNHQDPQLQMRGALGFLFFSHFFWLLFVPLAIFFLETGHRRRRLLLLTAMFGGTYGASLFMPLAMDTSRVTIEVIRHSIEYHTALIYDGILGRTAIRGIYAVVIIGPLLLSSQLRLRIFGSIVLISVIFAAWQFGHAFISVWCFLAAVVSLFVVYITRQMSQREPSSGESE